MLFWTPVRVSGSYSLPSRFRTPVKQHFLYIFKVQENISKLQSESYKFKREDQLMKL